MCSELNSKTQADLRQEALTSSGLIMSIQACIFCFARLTIRHMIQRTSGVQKVEDHVQCLESSSDTSTSVNGADNNRMSEAGCSNGGHIWDTSGVAVDYTFKVSLTRMA